jgi:histone deacetylase 11
MRGAHGVDAARLRASALANAIDDAALARVHTPQVLAGLRSARWVAQVVELAPLALLPSRLVSAQVVTPQRRAAAGTLSALRVAYAGGWAANLSGGFHHARPDLCHGFCLLNDVAFAVARLRLRRRLPKSAV